MPQDPPAVRHCELQAEACPAEARLQGRLQGRDEAAIVHLSPAHMGRTIWIRKDEDVAPQLLGCHDRLQVLEASLCGFVPNDSGLMVF